MTVSSDGNTNNSGSMNSGRERHGEMINLEVNDIVRMSEESFIDSFKSMETVIRYEYRTEIVKGIHMVMDEIVIFFINLRISLWPMLKKYPATVYQSQVENSQFWAIVIIAAKCYGEIFANMSIGYFLLSLLFDKEIPSLLFIYSKISLAERRWLILVFSFWVGASTHFILINWNVGTLPSPPLYSPTLVALLFEFVGPTVAYNRPLLLLSTIGIASWMCFAYAYINACLTFTYFYTSLIAIASSFYSMQQHLADPTLGYLPTVFLCRRDMSEGHVLLPIHSMYNQLAITLIFGHYRWDRNPKAVAPNTLEERYTLLLRRLLARSKCERLTWPFATLKITLGAFRRPASLSRELRSQKAMEIIKTELGLGSIEELQHRFYGGCISRAKAYKTDKYGNIFVKFNDNEKAREMFDGEFASLQTLLNTNIIRIPKPIKTFSADGECCLAMEFIDMRGPSDSERLGTSIAKLHLHNKTLIEASKRNESTIGGIDKQREPIEKFGFHVRTYNGYCPLINEWSDNWVEFYSQNRLKNVIDIIVEKTGDRELLALWPKLERKIPEYFKGCDIYPCLLHGDLWFGNYSFTKDGPVIFDPASFYGHSEFEFGFWAMFGGFDEAFHTAYHKIIPQTAGFTQRVLLYQLFHRLNRWNHYGDYYKQDALNLMQKLS
ncbi:unnamed protein product [Litomosoides sigmodontis]|uniref:protein-ribulosamine 3-kinase n=1 Tax=Litomosoides sigmodontis TaxID=42156 RepID=A0A3P6TX08_LITSI|nr:unnamed protein product [Litomosoides sigmodontis]